LCGFVVDLLWTVYNESKQVEFELNGQTNKQTDGQTDTGEI